MGKPRKTFRKRWKIAKKAFKEFITVSKYVVLTEHKTFRIIEDVYKGLSLLEVSKRGRIPIEILFSGIKNKKLRITLKYKHSGCVLSVAFSPNGRLIATGSSDKMLRVFDIERKEAIFEYKHSGGVLSVAFSPNGRLIATGSRGIIRVLEAEWIVFEYKHGGDVLSVAFSPDGRLIATGSSDKMLRVFDLKKKEVIFEYKHGSPVYSVAFSPDGGLIATGSYDEMLRVFEFYIA